jgi:hypothetical protein
MTAGFKDGVFRVVGFKGEAIGLEDEVVGFKGDNDPKNIEYSLRVVSKNQTNAEQ